MSNILLHILCQFKIKQCLFTYVRSSTAHTKRPKDLYYYTYLIDVRCHRHVAYHSCAKKKVCLKFWGFLCSQKAIFLVCLPWNCLNILVSGYISFNTRKRKMCRDSTLLLVRDNLSTPNRRSRGVFLILFTGPETSYDLAASTIKVCFRIKRREGTDKNTRKFFLE